MTQMTHKCPECGTYYNAEQECDWDGVQTVRAPDPQGFVTWDLPPQNRHGEAGIDGGEGLVPVPDEDPARAERGYVRMVPDGTAAAEPFTCWGLSSFCAEVGHKCRAAGKCVYTPPNAGLPILHGESKPPSAAAQSTKGDSDGR